MKNAADIAKKYIQKSTQDVMVQYIAEMYKWRKLDDPVMASSLECTSCGSKDYHIALVDPSKGAEKVWLCANAFCGVNNSMKKQQAMSILPLPRRAIGWASMCEISGIGDLFHDVQFEKIKQTPAKIDFMLKFVSKPTGILLMQGDPGTGKTYASMAMCELFTRKSTSCVFTTQKKMMDDWMLESKLERPTNFLRRITECELLVIDDFGTGEVSTGFMRFFMDLINSRVQWSNRGTVITTNLCDDKLTDCVGEAVADRLRSGQKFLFSGKSRRNSKVL